MPRNHMTPERLSSRLIHAYTDCITIEDGELNYEDTCWKMSIRIMETLSDSQQDSVFGFKFDDQQECFDYIVKKIPGLCEYIIEYIENNDFMKK